MKNKRIRKKERADVGIGASVNMILLVTVLLCGAVAGCITASYVDGESGQALSGYVNQYISQAGSSAQGKLNFVGAAVNLYKYPIIVFLLGYTVFGIVAIPAVVGMRGFFLSFSVASVVRVFGYKGLVVSLAVYGLPAVISIPCLLLIASMSMRASQGFLGLMRAGKQRQAESVIPQGYLSVFGICAAVLACAVILEVFLTPKLILWASAFVL